MSLPARIAASAGCKPAVPTMAISTMSAAGSVASFINPSAPEKTSGRRAERVAQPCRFGRIADGNRLGSVLARLLQQQFDIVARRQPEQPNAIRQILRHLDGAGADRAGAAEKNDVFAKLKMQNGRVASERTH